MLLLVVITRGTSHAGLGPTDVKACPTTVINLDNNLNQAPHQPNQASTQSQLYLDTYYIELCRV
jgi:hypothetical protein